MSNFADRGGRFAGRVLTARIGAQVKFQMTLFLYRFSNLTREGIHTSFIGSMVRHATRCHLCFRSLISTICRIISHISGEGSHASVNFGRRFRAPTTNCLFRFAMGKMFKEDNGLINDCSQGVVRRRVFVWEHRLNANYAVRGREIRCVRACGLIVRRLNKQERSFLYRLFLVV